MPLKCRLWHPGFRRRFTVMMKNDKYFFSTETYISDSEDSIQNFAVQMTPQYHDAIVDLILHYDWRSIIYIFQSSEGLYRLQKIYENIPKVSKYYRWKKCRNCFKLFSANMKTQNMHWNYCPWISEQNNSLNFSAFILKDTHIFKIPPYIIYKQYFNINLR